MGGVANGLMERYVTVAAQVECSRSILPSPSLVLPLAFTLPVGFQKSAWACDVRRSAVGFQKSA